MTIRRGRIVRGDDAATAVALDIPSSPVLHRSFGRRVLAAEMNARQEAQRIIDEATTSGAAIVERALGEARRVRESAAQDAAHVRAAAVEEAARLRESAKDEAHREAQAAASAAIVAMRTAEERAVCEEADRVIAVAQAVSERLVGHAIESQPSAILEIAREALREARGAREITINAHPDDCDVLKSHLADLGVPSEIVQIQPSTLLSRGDLILHTELGTLNAKLQPRLERLIVALRDRQRR